MSTLVRFSPNARLSVPAWNRTFGPSFGRLIDEFFGSGLEDDGDIVRTAWAPAADVRETEEAFRVDVELPGLTKDDIDISLEKNVLTVRGERRYSKDETGEAELRTERAYGKFSRSFRLPRPVDNDGVEASFTDGVLRLVLPKSAEARPRQIKIN